MENILKFKVLAGIARADNEFDKSEKDFILRLADQQGISLAELKSLLKMKVKTSHLITRLDFNDKIEILTDAVRLMKIDGKVLLSEIRYCEKVAKMLGFQEKVVQYLSGIVDGDSDIASNYVSINHKIREYVIEE